MSAAGPAAALALKRQSGLMAQDMGLDQTTHAGQEQRSAVSCSWFDAKYPVGNLERDDKLTEAKLAREKTLHKLRRWQRQKQKRASGSESATTIASAGGSGASNAMNLVVSDDD